ncbi:MAG: hypothetical protein CMF62_10100 [Magnetococcales bacterium]|nr:hypothetical protein [Magnetococcales bacterium]
MPKTTHLSVLALTVFFSQTALCPSAHAQAVPGYVPPVMQTRAPDYVDDTRGVFVPNHTQFRLKDETELNRKHGEFMLAQANTGMHNDDFEREMNRISGAGSDIDAELNRIAGQDAGAQAAPSHHRASLADGRQGQATPMAPAMGTYMQQTPGYNAMQGGGVEVAVGQVTQRPSVDMQNSLVRVREERITVRRVLQRMMDKIGASDWTILWDLSEQNMPLAEMEISIDAHEPFTNVLNALLARLQTRSGQPLRVIRYDNTKRLVITDRGNGHSLAGSTEDRVSPIGVGAEKDPIITENVLKEAMISLHYDEIPLVDALESIVNQAGKGQCRLRIYAGVDQVLKPAHIEEPFSIAMERLLRLFNLKYEIFPGGKLVVVTQTSRFGFNGGQ